MKTYTIAVPITGVIYVDVKANSEEDALEAALESEDLSLDKCEEWEAHEHIVRGNVFYGHQNKIEVVAEFDDEEQP